MIIIVTKKIELQMLKYWEEKTAGIIIKNTNGLVIPPVRKNKCTRWRQNRDKIDNTEYLSASPHIIRCCFFTSHCIAFLLRYIG